MDVKMRELKIFKDDDLYPICASLIYDKDKDSDSEKAMWTIDSLFYDLKPGDVLKIVCVR